LIWAHLGRAAPDVLAGVLARNSNIYTDISAVFPYGHHDCCISESSLDCYREYTLKNCVVDTTGALKPEWRPVFERYSDRVMIGTDAMSAKCYEAYEALTNQIRDVLSGLDEKAARTIASENAIRVFKL
jgi:predicted TIM-barrel fold metal-dependent hydrolase